MVHKEPDSRLYVQSYTRTYFDQHDHTPTSLQKQYVELLTLTIRRSLFASCLVVDGQTPDRRAEVPILGISLSPIPIIPYIHSISYSSIPTLSVLVRPPFSVFTFDNIVSFKLFSAARHRNCFHWSSIQVFSKSGGAPLPKRPVFPPMCPRSHSLPQRAERAGEWSGMFIHCWMGRPVYSRGLFIYSMVCSLPVLIHSSFFCVR